LRVRPFKATANLNIKSRSLQLAGAPHGVHSGALTLYSELKKDEEKKKVPKKAGEAGRESKTHIDDAPVSPASRKKGGAALCALQTSQMNCFARKGKNNHRKRSLTRDSSDIKGSVLFAHRGTKVRRHEVQKSGRKKTGVFPFKAMRLSHKQEGKDSKKNMQTPERGLKEERRAGENKTLNRAYS